MFVIDENVKSAYHAIRAHLLYEEGFTWYSIKQSIPPGWINCIEYLEGLTERIEGYKVTEYLVHKGLLRIRAQHSDRINNEIFEYVAQYCAKASSNTCIVCGEKGLRRRQEELWPCLCNEHYVQYANYEAEQRSFEVGLQPE